MKRFKWVVEFIVAERWVEDGFDLDNHRAKVMLQEDLTFATPDEIDAKVLKSPNTKEILKAQGY